MRKIISLFGCGTLLIFMILLVNVNPAGNYNGEPANIPPKGSAFDSSVNDLIYREVSLNPSSMRDNDGLYPATMTKSYITAYTDNSISYHFYKTMESTNWLWQWNASATENYNYTDMVIGSSTETFDQLHYIIPTNLNFPTFFSINQTAKEYNMGKWGWTGAFINITESINGYNRFSIQGPTNKGIYNVTTVWNASKGVLMYMFRGNGTVNSTTECVYYNGMSPVNIFGIIPGQTMRYAEMDLNDTRKPILFLRDEILYTYYNPEYKLYKLLVNRTCFNNVSETSLNYSKPWRLYGEVNPDDWNSTILQYAKYFPSNMFSDMNRLRNSNLGTLPTRYGFYNLNMITGNNWYEMTGNYPNGNAFYWFDQAIPNSGALQLSISKETDLSGNVVSHKALFAIKGPGVVTSATWLGVAIGDEWTVVHQREANGYQSNSYGGNSWNNDEFNYMQIKVTHIFGLNRTVMAVCGDIYHWRQDGDTKIKVNEFQPLLINDPTSEFSFINQAGWEGNNNQGGPSLLVPKNIDLSLSGSQTSLLNKLQSVNNMQFNRSHFASRSGFMMFQEQTSNTYKEEYMNFEFTVDGIMSHYENRRRIENHTNNNNWNEYTRDVGILVETTKTTTKATVTDVTDTKAGQTYIWSHSRYSKDDASSNASAKQQNKLEILSVLSACEDYVVFIGKRYYKDANASDFNAKQWNASGIMMNLWILGSVQKGNVWSWVMQEAMFFDKSIDLTASTTKSDFAGIINFMYGASITSANVNATKFTIRASVVEGGLTKSMSIALNANGTLQDMLMGEQTTSGDWNNWERTVLVTAPIGMSVGEIFENPPNYVTETTENLGDFFVDGYQLNFVVLFAILGITWILVKRRHH